MLAGPAAGNGTRVAGYLSTHLAGQNGDAEDLALDDNLGPACAAYVG